MKTNDKVNQVIVVLFVFIGTLVALAHYGPQKEVAHQPHAQPYVEPYQPAPPPEPRMPAITNSMPGYQDYNSCVAQIKKWEQEAPDFVEVDTYGKSSRGTDIYYIKLTNELNSEPKPVVLITASIHGNEPWSTSTTMGYIGTLLDTYGQDQEATKLLNERVIYFVPVVSPDSYPRSRHVDGVDPNRNFPTEREPNRQSVPPVQELRDFFMEIKPNAVISGHTYGRVYLHPWGDKTQLSQHDADFKRIIGEMGRLSNYRVIRACQMYGRPIYGTEVDWYYRNGAMSVVMEFGTHQRIPSMQDTKGEFDRTYKAVKYFIREAPVVQIRWYWKYHSMPYYQRAA